jgi:hypothetical protein
VIGTSRAKVEKARAILDHAPEVLEQVLSGAKSINKAYTETQALCFGMAPFLLPGRGTIRLLPICYLAAFPA